jgi:hypothetical protein
MRTVTTPLTRRLAAFAVVAAVLACSPSALAASRPVLSLPQLSHKNVQVVNYGSSRALLVRSLNVEHDPGVETRASCAGCPRLSSHLQRETHPGPTVTRYSRLDWIIRPGGHVKILAYEPEAIGRYLLFSVSSPLSKRSLVVRASGCLNGDRQRIACPPAEEVEKGPPPGTQSTFEETVGGETHTFTDYHNASGEGPVIQDGQTVEVSCRVEGLPVEDGDVWWYRIASSPWSERYYASADPFYNNGQKTGPLEGTPFFDPRVPTC